jgi:transcriptional regulator with XRE-family HTH domain
MLLLGTARCCDDVRMADHQADDRKRLAVVVRGRRLELGWSKQRAADEARITITTYRQVEAGRSVRDTTYAGIERAFGWAPGACRAVLGGAEAAQPAGEVVEGVRIAPVAPPADVEGAVRQAVQYAVIGTMPETSARQMGDLNEAVIEFLRRRGVIPKPESEEK